MATCDQSARTVQIDLNEVRGRNERDGTNDQTDHHELIVRIAQTEWIALRDLLDKKAQIVPVGRIEWNDRLVRIEPRGPRAPRELVALRGHPVLRVPNEANDRHVPTDRNETIGQPALTDPLARKAPTGQPLTTVLLARIGRVLLVKNAESGMGMPSGDLDHPVPQLRKSRQVLAMEFMTTTPSNLLTTLRRTTMTLT